MRPTFPLMICDKMGSCIGAGKQLVFSNRQVASLAGDFDKRYAWVQIMTH